MKYVFEYGLYPDVYRSEDLQFDSDELAIEHAKSTNVDYVWGYDDRENPWSVYRKSEDEHGKTTN